MGQDLNFTIGKRIKDVRHHIGLTQSALAELTDLSVPYISYIECGKKIPSMKSLIKIVDALGITVNEVLYGQQKSDNTAYQTDMDLILSDCSDNMKQIIYEIVRFFVKIMNDNRLT